MGAGIAIVATRAGFRTISFDFSEARLDHAAQQTAAFFNKSVERGDPSMRPLEGVFVLDFSTLLPGPMSTLLLAEAGAEVVKVERPVLGDEMRSYTPKWGRYSVNFGVE